MLLKKEIDLGNLACLEALHRKGVPLGTFKTELLKGKFLNLCKLL